MTDTVAQVAQVQSSDPTPVADQRNINIETTTVKIRRLSRWFVNNQKVDGWDEETLNTLHTGTIVLLFVAYVCHIVSSPYIELIHSTTIITTLSVIQVVCLILGIACFVKACYVNSSWEAAKLMFNTCIRTYIFGFWLFPSPFSYPPSPKYNFSVDFHYI